MEIIAIKLVTGEDVIGEFFHDPLRENPEKLTLVNPVAITIQQDERGNPAIQFPPFPFYSKGEKGNKITIDKRHIVYTYEPMPDIAEHHKKLFGAGLILPKEKQLIVG